MTSIHLDTDIGGDPDDACALALLAAWPGVEVTGITTNLDEDGRRAGCATHVARLAGLDVVPLPGAATTMSGERFPTNATDARYWGRPIEPVHAAAGAALDALASAIDRGDTIVTIGALTNLALLEVLRPGSLRRARVVAMGGWRRPLAPGLPQWGPERDFNLRCDEQATELVLGAAGDLTLVTLPATAVAHLRRRDLPRLRATGPLGELLARQAEAYAADTDRATLAAAHEALPDDLLNFHWDPVTCAVAAGWDGVVVEDGAVVWVDGDAFPELFLSMLERLPHPH